MSIVDFTTGLFHDPANLRAFVDDPDQALRDAGLPDVTPEQVHAFLPVVAESMPPDHPLQSVVHAADPQAALQNLDVDEVCSLPADKALSDVGGKAGKSTDHATDNGSGDDHVIIEPVEVGRWKQLSENDKGLGETADDPGAAPADDAYGKITDDPVTPEIEGGSGERDDDHAMREDVAEPEFSSSVWDKAIE
jgi:hypothetical protein